MNAPHNPYLQKEPMSIKEQFLKSPMFWALGIFFCFSLSLWFIEDVTLKIYLGLAVGFIIGVLFLWRS